MILNHKNFTLNKSKIKIKKTKIFEDFTFIPINYDCQDLIIQTPILFVLLVNKNILLMIQKVILIYLFKT